MAFTNPILAGEEIIRDAISSGNYIPGVSGWSIKKNGAAEFDNMTVRQTLTVGNSIILQGKDLATVLNSRSLGCIAWMGGYPVVQTTSEDQIMYTEADVINGRWYDISLTNITPDVGNVKATEFRLRATDGTSFPNNSSPVMSISLRLSQFEMGNIRQMWQANYTGKLRLRASIGSLDGQAVRCWAPGYGCVLSVIDCGVAPGPNGISGNVSPGKTLKEWTIKANFCRSYANTGSRLDNYLAQANYDASNQAWQGWCTFDGAGQALLADLAGVPQGDFVVAEMLLDALNWWDGTGTAIIGYHNTPTLGAGLPAGGVYTKLFVTYSGTGAGWFNLMVGGFGAGSIMDGFRSGYTKGMLVGRPNENATVYSGFFQGSPTANTRPSLHLKYYK